MIWVTLVSSQKEKSPFIIAMIFFIYFCCSFNIQQLFNKVWFFISKKSIAIYVLWLLSQCQNRNPCYFQPANLCELIHISHSRSKSKINILSMENSVFVLKCMSYFSLMKWTNYPSVTHCVCFEQYRLWICAILLI